MRAEHEQSHSKVHDPRANPDSFQSVYVLEPSAGGRDQLTRTGQRGASLTCPQACDDGRLMGVSLAGFSAPSRAAVARERATPHEDDVTTLGDPEPAWHPGRAAMPGPGRRSCLGGVTACLACGVSSVPENRVRAARWAFETGQPDEVRPVSLMRSWLARQSRICGSLRLQTLPTSS